MKPLKVLITVKTYPIPSKTYDELVCTAGVTEAGEFVRLYPINFRELEYDRQFKKYQWIEVMAEKHTGRDSRKESYRPNCETLRVLGEPIPTKRSGDWSERARYVLANKARSMEELKDRQKADRTSLGVFHPAKIHDLLISDDDADWKPSFKKELAQARLWDRRTVTKVPPRKVPFKFHYKFECDDERCKRNHKMMVVDWEAGVLYWRLVDEGATPSEAAGKVRDKFLNQMCGTDRDTHFFVGTTGAFGTWVVIGLFWPKKPTSKESGQTASLFD